MHDARGENQGNYGVKGFHQTKIHLNGMLIRMRLAITITYSAHLCCGWDANQLNSYLYLHSVFQPNFIHGVFQPYALSISHMLSAGTHHRILQ